MYFSNWFKVVFNSVFKCQFEKMHPREEGDAGYEINQMKKKHKKLINKWRKGYMDVHYHFNIVWRF